MVNCSVILCDISSSLNYQQADILRGQFKLRVAELFIALGSRKAELSIMPGRVDLKSRRGGRIMGSSWPGSGRLRVTPGARSRRRPVCAAY